MKSVDNNHRVHILLEMKQVSVSAHPPGAYTATLLVTVNVMKGGGRAHECKPVLQRLSLAGNLEKTLLSLHGTEWTERGYGLWANFTLMMECTPCTL